MDERETFLEKFSDLMMEYDKTLDRDDKYIYVENYVDMNDIVLVNFFEWVFDNYK